MSAYTVVALYVFTPIADPATAKHRLAQEACSRGVCGTLLVAPEGFNGTIAATSRDALEAMIASVADLAGLDPAAEAAGATEDCAGRSAAHRRLELKWSTAEKKPFQRLKVKLKPEIVTLRQPHVDPAAHVGAYVDAADWNALISRPDVVLIDTRNRYEVEIGTFAGALNPDTLEFREFPAWVAAHRSELEGKTIATFCTGGIRCEKATAYLQAEGFPDVHHLKGGILRYLEDIPEDKSLWQGACFVFDERVGLEHGLKESGHKVCRTCQRAYLGDACPRCEAEGAP